MTTSQNSRKSLLLLIFGVFSFGMTLLMGCNREEIPESPNAKTAAPARLPGEDPHAHSIPAPAGSNK